jgi:AsmA protein
LAFAGPEREAGIDLDMRISAEHFRAGPYEAGPLALALSARPDRFSIDIAELALFGGTVTGRLDYDSAHPASLSLNASGTRLSSQALTGALGWPFSVSGPVSVRLALELPFKGSPAAADIRAATGRFAIDFPAGGALEGDISRNLSTALSQREILWGLGSSSFAFTAASIEGVTEPAGIAVRIDGESAVGRIGGSLRITSPDNAISGTLSLTDAPETVPLPEGAPAEPLRTANILLSGTAAALNFSPAGKPSLSN